MADQENNAVFTQEEQGRVLFHLGYQAQTVASFLSMGTLALTETQFVAVNALQHIPASRVGIIRDLIVKLDEIHERIFGAIDYLYAENLAELKPNLNITNALEGEYTRWAQRLADALGVYTNPFSDRFNAGKQPMNRRVARVV